MVAGKIASLHSAISILQNESVVNFQPLLVPYKKACFTRSEKNILQQ